MKTYICRDVVDSIAVLVARSIEVDSVEDDVRLNVVGQENAVIASRVDFTATAND